MCPTHTLPYLNEILDVLLNSYFFQIKKSNFTFTFVLCLQSGSLLQSTIFHCYYYSSAPCRRDWSVIVHRSSFLLVFWSSFVFFFSISALRFFSLTFIVVVELPSCSTTISFHFLHCRCYNVEGKLLKF